MVRCPNPRCPGVIKRRIAHFVSRGAMDIEGRGREAHRSARGRRRVRELSDLYALDEAALAALERMGETSGRATCWPGSNRAARDRCRACSSASASCTWARRWPRSWRSISARWRRCARRA